MQKTLSMDRLVIVTATAGQDQDCDYCKEAIVQGDEVRLLSITDVEPGQYSPRIVVHPPCLAEIAVQMIKAS